MYKNSHMLQTKSHTSTISCNSIHVLNSHVLAIQFMYVTVLPKTSIHRTL